MFALHEGAPRRVLQIIGQAAGLGAGAPVPAAAARGAGEEASAAVSHADRPVHEALQFGVGRLSDTANLLEREGPFEDDAGESAPAEKGGLGGRGVAHLRRGVQLRSEVHPQVSHVLHDQGIDAKSIHCYFTPFKVPKKEKRLVLLSEYGGYSYQEKGHVFNNKKFGYRIYKDKESLNAAYKKLHEKLIIPAIKDGLAATVYTQVSDVESEINGLLTYDRRVLKVDPDMVRAVNAQLKL